MIQIFHFYWGNGINPLKILTISQNVWPKGTKDMLLAYGYKSIT